jgi:outer membrane protein TolC
MPNGSMTLGQARQKVTQLKGQLQTAKKKVQATPTKLRFSQRQLRKGQKGWIPTQKRRRLAKGAQSELRKRKKNALRDIAKAYSELLKAEQQLY